MSMKRTWGSSGRKKTKDKNVNKVKMVFDLKKKRKRNVYRERENIRRAERGEKKRIEQICK